MPGIGSIWAEQYRLKKEELDSRKRAASEKGTGELRIVAAQERTSVRQALGTIDEELKYWRARAEYYQSTHESHVHLTADSESDASAKLERTEKHFKSLWEKGARG